MAIETAIAAVAEVAAEATVAESLSEVSGATELSETLSAIQKEVPREIIKRVDACSRMRFPHEILEQHNPDSPNLVALNFIYPRTILDDYQHFKIVTNN